MQNRIGGRAALGAAAVALMTGIAACGGTTNPASSGSGSATGQSSSSGKAAGKTIVFSVGTLSVPAFAQLAKGVQALGTQKGYTVVVQDGKGSAQTQITQLEQAIGNGQAAGVYAIMLDPKSSLPALQAAQKAGVPMLTTGKPSDFGLSGMQAGVSFDTNDPAATGKTLGTKLGECINSKMGGKAQVIEATSAPGTAGASDQVAAQEAALKATAPGASIVTKVMVTTDRSKAQTDLGSALQGHPNANAMLGNIDEAAFGAIGAWAAAGKNLPCVVTAGGTPESFADVKSGKIYTVVQLDFQADLEQSVNTLIGMMKSPKSLGKQLRVPDKIVTATK